MAWLIDFVFGRVPRREPSAGVSRQRPATPNHTETLTKLLDTLEALVADHQVGSAGDARVRMRDIMGPVGRRSYAPFLLLLGLLSLSPVALVPGMNWFAASIMLVLTVQMTIGARHPWLPRKLLDTKLSRSSVRSICAFTRPWAAGLDRLFKPRFCFLTEAPFVNLAGLFCTLAALSIFPLGLMPLAPFAPSLAITAVALGLFLRDGLLLLCGAAIVAGAMALTYRLIG